MMYNMKYKLGTNKAPSLNNVPFFNSNITFAHIPTSSTNSNIIVINKIAGTTNSSKILDPTNTTASIRITSSSTSISTWNTTTMSIYPSRLYLTTNLYNRIGNQMFMYASLVGLARAQDRVPFVRSGRDLISVFRVTHIREGIKTDGWRVLNESAYATFDSKFMKLPPQNMIIYGFFQCWRYFQHAKEEIRREFTFTSDIRNKVQTTLSTYRNRLENHVLVGVHVRRGDFLKSQNFEHGYRVASASYFFNAFAKMRSILTNKNITFLVGGDDLDWCQNNLKDAGIEILPNGSPVDHFAILSSCDNTIISSGTFGWWIGWLANGVTIYCKNFIAKDSFMHEGFNEPDYYPVGWIGLED